MIQQKVEFLGMHHCTSTTRRSVLFPLKFSSSESKYFLFLVCDILFGAAWMMALCVSLTHTHHTTLKTLCGVMYKCMFSDLLKNGNR